MWKGLYEKLNGLSDQDLSGGRRDGSIKEDLNTKEYMFKKP